MSSSARTSSDCGIVSPGALAVLRLMTSSNFDACSTGRSLGRAPPENLVHIRRRTTEQISEARSVGHQAARHHDLSEPVHDGSPLLGGELHAVARLANEHWIGQHDGGLRTALHHRCKGLANLPRRPRLQDIAVELQHAQPRRFPSYAVREKGWWGSRERRPVQAPAPPLSAAPLAFPPTRSRRSSARSRFLPAAQGSSPDPWPRDLQEPS